MKTSDERVNSINKKVKAKRNRRAVIWTSTVCACVFVALTVVCSLPILGTGAPNINAYKNDEYYPLIQKINSRYENDKYSIFSKIGDLGSVIFGGATSEPPMDSLPAADGTARPVPPTVSSSEQQGNGYEETTLNQVNGVTEGDLLKRSKTHAFYLTNSFTQNWEPCLTLQIYNLAGNATERVSEYSIRAKDGTSLRETSKGYISAEIFLNDDATRLTVITACLNQQYVVLTTVVSLDVSNVNNVTEVNRVYVSGRYLSGRKVDGKFLIITNFNIDTYKDSAVAYDNKATYVPQCGSAVNSDYLPIEDIYIPNKCQNLNYTVLAMLDETTLKVCDSYATFSYSHDVFVSRNYLVVARNSYYYYKDSVEYGKEIEPNGITSTVNAQVCEMVAVKYGEKGFDKVGEIGVDGYVKDRYSMDEREGILRVFTTVNHSKSFGNQLTTNVSLYCIDLSTMQVVASKPCFAPQGDEVKSARFDGDAAYVCTARRNTDPVFYFDLSDLGNITCVDTGEIEGFSVNLVKFGDLLLGIGQGEHSGILKAELYRQSDNSEAVVSVAKFERECGFSYEPKAHFVDAEHNLIGLQIYDYTSGFVTSNPNASRYKYLLLHFDGENLTQFYCDQFDSRCDYARAFYKDSGVYVFGENGFTFIDLQQDAA